MARPRVRGRAFGRTTLSGTFINDIKLIEQLTIETEKEVQRQLVVINEEVADRVRLDIVRLDVLETGATLNSVGVVYPPSYKVQQQIRNFSPAKQAESLGTKTLESYQRAKFGAEEARPKLKTRIKQIDERTGRRTKLASGGLDYRDVPLNPIPNVGRGNLYSAVYVGTYYSIFPHDGLGTSAEKDYINPQKPKGPRDFFASNVRWGQGELRNGLLKLEPTVRGKLKLKR